MNKLVISIVLFSMSLANATQEDWSISGNAQGQMDHMTEQLLLRDCERLKEQICNRRILVTMALVATLSTTKDRQVKNVLDRINSYLGAYWGREDDQLTPNAEVAMWTLRELQHLEEVIRPEQNNRNISHVESVIDRENQAIDNSLSQMPMILELVNEGKTLDSVFEVLQRLFDYQQDSANASTN